ncbi:MAG: hypothetical protein ACR2OU_00340, partial [Thermomicrobiales bacterium]
MSELRTPGATMTTYRVTRRTFTAVATGIAAGVFAGPLLHVAGQEATAIPGEATPVAGSLGFVSTRLRFVTSPEARVQVNEAVLGQFVNQVKGLDGYAGYLLGDVIDQPSQSPAIVVLEHASQLPAFREAASGFVTSVADNV